MRSKERSVKAKAIRRWGKNKAIRDRAKTLGVAKSTNLTTPKDDGLVQKKAFTTSNPVKNTHTKTTKVTFVQKRLHLTVFIFLRRKLPTTELDLNEQLILRHYGDTKANVTRRRRKDHPSSLVNGMPQIPEVKQQDPAQQKLHYRINDGSSFI